MNQVIGTCSICGGRAVVPDVWMGITPPTPECVDCGAIAAQDHGPVIQMRPRPGSTTITNNYKLVRRPDGTWGVEPF